MKYIGYLAFVVLFCSACEKLFLGEEEINSPENNFEVFWKDFDEHYGLFEVRGWDWDQVYDTYRPRVTAQTTDEELWDIFRQMVAYLDDSHTFIYAPDEERFFASGSEQDERTESEFSLGLLIDKYLDKVEKLDLGDPEENYIHGKLKGKDIGYLYLSDIEASDDNFMDDVLEAIGSYKALVLDVRNNTGGDDAVSAQIAGRFADKERLAYTVQTKNGPGSSDFSEATEFFSAPMGAESFDKPVVVLTDRITVSAAEVLLMHLKSFPTVIQLGDTTAGDFSDVSMRRFLPNGWQYQYSIMTYYNAEGQSLDGLGHVPDILLRNTAANIEAGEDRVIEGATNFLFDTYGIE